MKRLFWNRHTKLVLRHMAGWFCILAGIIMFVTPGQGILTILIGVYLLADEIPLFARLKNWLQHKFPKTTDHIHRKVEQLKAKLQKDKPNPSGK